MLVYKIVFINLDSADLECDFGNLTAQEEFGIHSFDLEKAKTTTSETFVVSDHPATDANRRVDQGNYWHDKCKKSIHNFSKKSLNYTKVAKKANNHNFYFAPNESLDHFSIKVLLQLAKPVRVKTFLFLMSIFDHVLDVT